MKVCLCSVAIQFSLNIFILAVHFNSFRVEVNSVVEVPLSEFFITFIFVNLCYC